jgi:hypothetical protein
MKDEEAQSESTTDVGLKQQMDGEFYFLLFILYPTNQYPEFRRMSVDGKTHLSIAP